MSIPTQVISQYFISQRMPNQLRRQLIHLFDTEQDVRRLVADAQISATQIDFSGSAENFWHSVLTEAHKQGRVKALVEGAIGSYPNQEATLWQAFQVYIQTREEMNRAESSHRRPIPHLLPYLANRSAQEIELEATLKSRTSNDTQPLVCIIHGDEGECHDKFLDRLEHNALPKFLNLLAQRAPVKRYYVMWPEHCRQADSLQDQLRKNLASAVRNSPDATPVEINAILAQYPGPIMLHTHLLTEEWQAFGTDAAAAYIQFWQQWPPLAPGQFFLVCLCVKYQTKSHLGFLKRFRHRWANERIIKALENLTQAQSSQTTYKVLPKLERIRQQDVENWVESHAKQFCTDQDLLAQVRAIFRAWEKETASSAIPMEHLAVELNNLLQKYA